MDYGGIIKKAWNITWRYRVLWILGLFAGGASGGGSSSNFSQSEEEFDPSQFDSALQWMSENVALIAAGVMILLVIGLALWILSVAARGGLIHLVNEAEEGHPVRLGDGWGVGFSKWGRVFLIDLVLYLPFMILLVVMLFAALMPVISAAEGSDPMPALFSMCGALVFGGLILMVLGFVIALLENMAIRHGILDDTPAMQSIGAGWSDFRSRFKDLFVMWLIMLAIGLGFGMIIGVVGAMFGVAMAFAVMGGAWPVATMMGFVLFLVMLLPQAVFGTFSSAIWTIFFRYMTGRQVPEDDAALPRTQHGYEPVPPPPYGGTYPPPPAPPSGITTRSLRSQDRMRTRRCRRPLRRAGNRDIRGIRRDDRAGAAVDAVAACMAGGRPECPAVSAHVRGYFGRHASFDRVVDGDIRYARHGA